MKCNKCGKELPYGTLMCDCGNTFVYQESPQGQNINKGLSTTQKVIIIVLLLIVLALVGVLVLTSNKSEDNEVVKTIDPTRTIMIYMDGSTLETDGKIASTDLGAIDGKKIDLESTNVLVYVGGTKKWFNNFNPDENAIYKLDVDGFKKVQTYEKKNMGDAKTLSTFLNYAYENYKTGHYNLVFYNHGGAIDGAIYDDFTNDNLSLEEFNTALSSSPFKGDNKLDNVIFRTCLNGTLEVATIFKDYAKYIIFSEEVTWGSSISNVLGYFINDLDSSLEGDSVGKTFISAYNKQMEEIDPIGLKTVTYAIVDLSKVDNIVTKLNSFVDGIDIKENYYNISRVRNSLYQFGIEVPAYDTVDLKEFVTKLDSYSKGDASEVVKAINDAVVYKYSNLNESGGLSIYFPYKGNSDEKKYFMNVYDKLDSFDKYRSFMKKYISAADGISSFSFDYRKNTVNTKDIKNEVSIQLTKEQQDNYLGSIYMVFIRNKEHPDYYHLIYNSNDAILSEDGKLTTQIGNNLIKSKPNEEGKTIFFDVVHRVNDTKHTYSTNAILYKMDEKIGSSEFMRNCRLILGFKDGIPIISSVEKISRDQRLEGIAFDINEYDKVEKNLSMYKILDKKGKILPVKDWQVTPVYEGLGFEVKELELEKTTIDNEYEYYVVFNIFDVNQESNLSELIKVGE